MNAVSIGFYGEGNESDYVFLLSIVERAIRTIVHPAIDISVTPMRDEWSKADARPTGGYLRTDSMAALKQTEKMRKIAHEFRGYHLILIHLDADAPDYERARNKRYVPGLQYIYEINASSKEAERLNEDFVPIIPIRMTEAWMLVDFNAFVEVIGTDRTAKELDFPPVPKMVEGIPDPKLVFEEALRRCRISRRAICPSDVYLPLANVIRLTELAKVPAYTQFVNDLRTKLHSLHIETV